MLHIWTVWHPGVEPKTCLEHAQVFVVHEEVYWGIIHDRDYPTRYRHVLNDEELKQLRLQIKKGIPTYLFIEPRAPFTEHLWGEIDEVKKGSEFKGWQKDESVPRYYKELVKKRRDVSIDYWFSLKSFRKLRADISKKTHLERHDQYDTREYGKAGHPYPLVCTFTGETELRTFLRSETREPPDESVFRASPDYRSVNWCGEEISLSPMRAHVVEILHQAFLNGTPDVSQHYILETIGTTSTSLKEVFQEKDKESRIRGRLIIQGRTKGTVRLHIPS